MIAVQHGTVESMLNFDFMMRLCTMQTYLVIFADGRYDWTARKSLLRGYFLWSTVGYGLGLFLTYVALNVMNGSGQPALLYIVPCTLGMSSQIT